MRSFLPRFGRASALLLLALWAVEPVATWAHYGDHTHLYCPTHQTFEEGRRGEGYGAAVAPAASLAQLSQVPDAAQEQAPRKHEACSLPGCGPRPLVLPGPTLHLALGPSLLKAPVSAPRSVPAPPLSVLDTAPKASPPSRA